VDGEYFEHNASKFRIYLVAPEIIQKNIASSDSN
jgi:hypothetical protein